MRRITAAQKRRLWALVEELVLASRKQATTGMLTVEERELAGKRYNRACDRLAAYIDRLAGNPEHRAQGAQNEAQARTGAVPANAVGGNTASR